jgi:cell wall-associated NlpC family hydrolase
MERQSRLPTIATGDDFPHGAESTPVLIYTADAATVDVTDGEQQAPQAVGTGCFAPRYVAGWSHFYDLYPRRPELTNTVPAYVADRLKKLEGGVVGWGDHVKFAAWELGPQSSIEIAGAMPKDAVA